MNRPLIQSRPHPAPARELPFPPGTRLPALRALRKRLHRKGQLEAALQVALEVARRDPGRESLACLGGIQSEMGRYREALSSLRDGLRYRTGPAYLVSHIHVHIAHVWYNLGRFKRAGEALKRAWSARPKPRLEFSLHLVAGNVHMARTRYDEAVAEFHEASRTARTSDQRLRALSNQAIALILSRRVAEAFEPVGQAIRKARKLGDRLQLALNRGILAWAHSEEGQHARALRSALLAAADARAAGSTARDCELTAIAAVAADQLARHQQAHALFSRALSLAEIVGREVTVVSANSFFARDAARRGDLKEADRFLERARRRQRNRNDWVGRLHVLRAEHALAAAKGEIRDAFHIARHAERLAIQREDLPRVAEFRRKRAEAEERLGRAKAARIARKRARELDRIRLGLSPGERRLSRTLAKLSRSRLPVLLVGAPGPTTRALARKLHSRGPCVEVACEQVAHEQTELYGWIAGAWSGAERDGDGYAQKAEGGLLVLEGLDRVPRDRQKHFIDLVDRKVRRVGGTGVQEGGYRVAVICEEPSALIPGLRSRLSGAVLEAPGLDQGLPGLVRRGLGAGRRLTADALLELARHRWKGGEAELKGLLERLKVLSSSSVIGRKLVRQALGLDRRPAGVPAS